MKKKEKKPILANGIVINSKEIKDVGNNRVICKISYYFDDDLYEGVHKITGTSVCNEPDTFSFSVGSRIATLKAYKKANDRYRRYLNRKYVKISKELNNTYEVLSTIDSFLNNY